MPGTTPISSDAGAATAAERAVLCPYCGASSTGTRCAHCGGLFEPLSMQATQNEMGPWFIRDLANPFRPGCSHQTLRRLAERGRIDPETVMRGPTTRQFWSFARNVRGVAHLLGECHNCHGPASADEYMCRSCGAVFEAPKDRQHFGVGPVRLIPGQAPPEVVARATMPKAGADAPARAAVQSPASKAPARAKSPDQASQAATRAMRRRLAQMRRIVTLSIAINVVLIAAIIVTSLAPNLSFRSGAPVTETPENAVNSAPSAPVAVDLSAVVEEARRLMESEELDDWRRAEDLLAEAMQDVPAEQRPADAVELLAQIRERVDERSLEQFLPKEPPSQP